MKKQKAKNNDRRKYIKLHKNINHLYLCVRIRPRLNQAKNGDRRKRDVSHYYMNTYFDFKAYIYTYFKVHAHRVGRVG